MDIPFRVRVTPTFVINHILCTFNKIERAKVSDIQIGFCNGFMPGSRVYARIESKLTCALRYGRGPYTGRCALDLFDLWLISLDRVDPISKFHNKTSYIISILLCLDVAHLLFTIYRCFYCLCLFLQFIAEFYILPLFFYIICLCCFRLSFVMLFFVLTSNFYFYHIVRIHYHIQ